MLHKMFILMLGLGIQTYLTIKVYKNLKKEGKESEFPKVLLGLFFYTLAGAGICYCLCWYYGVDFISNLFTIPLVTVFSFRGGAA